jgi:hypothetical protein
MAASLLNQHLAFLNDISQLEETMRQKIFMFIVLAVSAISWLSACAPPCGPGTGIPC